MNIKTTTAHTITFTVEAFWDEEGGMGHDQYGQPVQELAQALRLLELARIYTPGNDWKIVGTVTTATTIA